MGYAAVEDTPMPRMIARQRIVDCRLCHQPRAVEAGDALRSIRRAAGLPIREVARRAHLSIPMVSAVERDAKLPPAELVKVYQALLEGLDRSAS